MKPKQILSILLAVLVTTSIFAGSAAALDFGSDDGPFSPPSLNEAGDNIVRYGTAGNVGIYVTYENGSYDDLAKWVNDSDDREFVARDNASNRVLLSAPSAAIRPGMLDRLQGAEGLASESYITSWEWHYRQELIYPVNALEGNETYTKPEHAFWTLSFEIPYISDGVQPFTTKGVAYAKDANQSTMGDVRETIGANNTTYTGAGVTVAVIDTGLNHNNGTIFGDGTEGSTLRIEAPINTITGKEGLDNVTDGNGHGTWVASSIASNHSDHDYKGVAPDATIIPIKALSDGGGGSTQDIIEGIEHASKNDADIISLSLGSPLYSDALANEVKEFLANGGTAAVIAVGNSRQTTRWVASPADVDDVIGVAATNNERPRDNDSHHAMSAYFSNVGPDPAVDGSMGITRHAEPTIGAPGMQIEAKVVDDLGYERTSSLSGTSMATPIVSGSLALLLEQEPDLQNESVEVKDRLTRTASPMPHAATSEVGAGMVNVTGLLQNETANVTQEDVMTEQATARDLGNEGLAFDYLPNLMRGMSSVADEVSSYSLF